MEGLVHISQLGREGRVTNVEQVVNWGDTVKVKVLSASGGKISLSMNDVDQITGENVNTTANKVVKSGREENLRMMSLRPVHLHVEQEYYEKRDKVMESFIMYNYFQTMDPDHFFGIQVALHRERKPRVIRERVDPRESMSDGVFKRTFRFR